MTPEKRKEAHRARIRATYHWYKAHGICIACGHEDVEPGKTRCAECAMKAAARDRAAYYERSGERRCVGGRESCMQSTGQRGSVLIAAKKRLQENGFIWIVFCDDAVMTNGTSMHIAA